MEKAGRTIARRHLMARRLMYGMTQRYLAKYTGLAQTTISAIERGTCMTRRGTMKRIADALHFKWEKFYEEEGVEIP